MRSIKSGNLYIKKRSFPEWLMFLVFFIPFTLAFFTELIGGLGFVKFVVDVSLVIALTILITKSISQSKGLYAVSRETLPFIILVSVFLIYTFIVYLCNYESALYYIWGMRNNFRFYLAFFVFIAFLCEEEVIRYFEILDFIFWVHAVISLIQFFFFDLEQDNLGGVFGAQKGCNGYIIVFMSVIVTKSMLSFMNGTEGTIPCFLKCGTSLLLAALAELKFFFFLFIFVLILSAVFTAFSFRKLILLVAGSLFLMVAYTILVAFFDIFDGFLSLEYLWESVTRTNYASKDDMSRITAIPTISRLFLTSVTERLFGMGLGNCDTSTISAFNTEFYVNYVDLHYSVFSVSFLFLETGYFGLLMYTLFFGFCFAFTLRRFRKNIGNRFFNQIALIISILSVMMMVYNSALRTEAGYMYFFLLALPFIENGNVGVDKLKANQVYE